jgi:predicted tellurium resistance membrane protein TerC
MAIVTVEIEVNFVPFLIISDVCNKNRILSYGIAGAVVFRAVMIILGTASIQVDCSHATVGYAFHLSCYIDCYISLIFCRNLRR